MESAGIDSLRCRGKIYLPCKPNRALHHIIRKEGLSTNMDLVIHMHLQIKYDFTSALVLDGIELVFSVAVSVGLCFGFVLKTVLVERDVLP